jgi:hypothetical protein
MYIYITRYNPLIINRTWLTPPQPRSGPWRVLHQVRLEILPQQRKRQIQVDQHHKEQRRVNIESVSRKKKTKKITAEQQKSESLDVLQELKIILQPAIPRPVTSSTIVDPFRSSSGFTRFNPLVSWKISKKG